MPWARYGPVDIIENLEVEDGGAGAAEVQEDGGGV